MNKSGNENKAFGELIYDNPGLEDEIKDWRQSASGLAGHRYTSRPGNEHLLAVYGPLASSSDFAAFPDRINHATQAFNRGDRGRNPILLNDEDAQDFFQKQAEFSEQSLTLSARIWRAIEDSGLQLKDWGLKLAAAVVGLTAAIASVTAVVAGLAVAATMVPVAGVAFGISRATGQSMAKPAIIASLPQGIVLWTCVAAAAASAVTAAVMYNFVKNGELKVPGIKSDSPAGEFQSQLMEKIDEILTGKEEPSRSPGL